MTTRDEADHAFDRWLKRGHPEDLASVFDRTAPRLLLLAAHLTGRGADAEDLVQATFVRAIQIAAERFERGRPVLPWLCGILALEAKKLSRDHARRPDPDRLASEAADAPDGPEAFAQSAELRRELERAIAALPDGYSQVLNLRLTQGMTPAEIAHALGLPPETVRTRIKRGVERLRARLPVGFAAALACLGGGAGSSLSAVREVVLAAVGSGAAGGATAVATTAAVAAAGGVSRSAVVKAASALAVVTAGVFGAVRYASDPEGGPVVEPRIGVTRPIGDPDAGPTRVPVLSAPVVAAPAVEEPAAEPSRFASLEGRFRDERGAVAGVDVTLIRLHADALVADWADFPAAVVTPPLVVGTAVTDSGGRYVFEQVPSGGVWLLRIAAPGRPPFVDLVAARPPLDERVDLGMCELPAVWEADGRVVDSRLRPLPGATVRRAPTVWGGAKQLGSLGPWLQAWNANPPRADIVLVQAPGAAGRDAVVEPPAWLCALAQLLDPPVVAADASGRFRWRSVHGFRDELWIEAPGHRPRVVGASLSRDGAEMQSTTLEPWDRIELTVVDPHGAPVVGAEVAAAPSAGAVDGVCALRRAGVTGPDGRIEVDGVRSASLTVAVRPADGDAWSVRRVPDGPVRTVRLPSRQPLVVRVGSRGGAGTLEGADARLWPATSGGGADVDALLLQQLGALRALGAEPVRGEDGELVFGSVPEGEFIAVVAAPGFVPRTIPLRVRGAFEVRVELVAAEELVVEAVDTGFRPLRGMSVVVAPSGRADAPHVLPAVAGATGRDATLALMCDRWDGIAFTLGNPGWGQASFAMVPGAASLKMVVPRAGGIDGTLLSATAGFAADGWLLEAMRTDAVVWPEVPVFVAPDRDGVARIAELPPGAWELRTRVMPGPLATFGAVLELLWSGVEPTTRTTVRVASGSSTGVRIDPEPPVAPPTEDEPDTLRGRVLLDGAPSSQLTLRIARAGRETSIALDADGQFDAGAVAPGAAELAVRVAVSGAPVEVWRAPIEVGQTATPIEIDLRAVPFTAIFTAATGARADRIAVDLSGEAGGEPRGQVGIRLQATTGGFAAFDHLPSGTYAVKVMDPRLGWLRRAGVRVGGANSTVGMSIQLERLLRVRARGVEARVDVPRTSEIDLVRNDPDGVELKRVAVCEEGGAFELDGLLPGRYSVTLRAARRVMRADQRFVLVSPSNSGIVVPLADLTVPEHDLDVPTLR